MIRDLQIIKTCLASFWVWLSENHCFGLLVPIVLCWSGMSRVAIWALTISGLWRLSCPPAWGFYSGWTPLVSPENFERSKVWDRCMWILHEQGESLEVTHLALLSPFLILMHLIHKSVSQILSAAPVWTRQHPRREIWNQGRRGLHSLPPHSSYTCTLEIHSCVKRLITLSCWNPVGPLCFSALVKAETTETSVIKGVQKLTGSASAFSSPGKQNVTLSGWDWLLRSSWSADSQHLKAERSFYFIPKTWFRWDFVQTEWNPQILAESATALCQLDDCSPSCILCDMEESCGIVKVKLQPVLPAVKWRAVLHPIR